MGASWIRDGERGELASWQTLRRRKVFDASPWFRVWREVVRLPDGREVDDYYSIDHPDFAVIFALSQEGRVLCLWHYKHGPRRVHVGLPAGQVMPGEEPLAAAQRELFEETGCTTETWQHLGSFTVDGNRGCGRAHVYLARSVSIVAEASPDDLEELQLQFVSVGEVRELLRSGQVATLAGAIGLSLGLLTLDGEQTMS